MKKTSLTILLLLSSVLFIIVLYTSESFQYIIARVFDPRMLESSRAYMSYMPFVWSADSNIFSFLFGHGIKSYSVIGSAFTLPNGDPVHVTSNNIYIDMFWESGLLGLLGLLLFFSYMFYKLLTLKLSKSQVVFGFLLFFDLTISGLFRADFASFRYFILLYFIFIVINYDLRKVRGINV